MTSSHPEVVDKGKHQISRSIVVDAPASVLFDLVVKPENHSVLDGRETVQAFSEAPERLTEGARMTAKMKVGPVSYPLTSTATEVKENEVVEWQHPLGPKWRWEFKAMDPNRTLVTETWDYRASRVPQLQKMAGALMNNAEGIEETLRRLQKRYA